MMLHVLATFIARPDAVAEVKTLLAGLVGPIRNDPGCTRCSLVVNAANEAEMVFIEEWKDGAELDQHLADPAIIAVVERVAPLLARPFSLDRYNLPG